MGLTTGPLDSMNVLQRLAFSPLFTQLVITRRCNLSCSYCNEFDRTSTPVPTETLKQRICQIKDLGSFSICLTGGEPFLHPDLCGLLSFCRHEQKFFRTSMITNGYFLTPDSIKQLNEAGLQDMQISIDGVTPNDHTVKVLAVLKKRLYDLKEHAKFNVVVSGVVGASPPSETFEVIAFAKQMGFRPRILLVHGADGQVKLTEEELLAYHQLKKLIPRHFYEVSDWRHQMIKTGEAPFKCRSGSRYLYVDEAGLVSWCSQKRDKFSKPLREYTPADLK
ncbi:MAG: radical SAM protein, partial [uncultured bacterium]